MYWLLTVKPPIVGCDGHFKFEAGNKKEASSISEEKAISHYETYGIDPESYAEEHGFELEYNYHLREVSKEEYDQSEYEEVS